MRRTRTPSLPSGRRLGSTSHSGGSVEGAAHTAAVRMASVVATRQRVGLVRPFGGLCDVDHVNIGHVVEFAGAAFAHRDDGRVGRCSWSGVSARAIASRCLQGRPSEVRQRCGPRRACTAKRVVRRHVDRGDAGERPPVRDAHGVDSLGARQRRDRNVDRSASAPTASSKSSSCRRAPRAARWCPTCGRPSRTRGGAPRSRRWRRRRPSSMPKVAPAAGIAAATPPRRECPCAAPTRQGATRSAGPRRALPSTTALPGRRRA